MHTALPCTECGWIHSTGQGRGNGRQWEAFKALGHRSIHTTPQVTQPYETLWHPTTRPTYYTYLQLPVCILAGLARSSRGCLRRRSFLNCSGVGLLLPCSTAAGPHDRSHDAWGFPTRLCTVTRASRCRCWQAGCTSGRSGCHWDHQGPHCGCQASGGRDNRHGRTGTVSGGGGEGVKTMAV